MQTAGHILQKKREGVCFRLWQKHRKKAVDDGSTALIFTYKLITKNSDIY